VLRDAWLSNAGLLLVVDPLPFATSKVSATLYYWWLNFQGEQDTGMLAKIAMLPSPAG
jgi:hypothetical protein